MIAPPPYGSARPNSPVAVTVPGDLLSTHVTAFRESVGPLAEQLAPGATLTIDLRGARLIDSVGLNALVSVVKAARARHAAVRLLVAQPSVRRILSFTRIDTHAEVVGPESA